MNSFHERSAAGSRPIGSLIHFSNLCLGNTHRMLQNGIGMRVFINQEHDHKIRGFYRLIPGDRGLYKIEIPSEWLKPHFDERSAGD